MHTALWQLLWFDLRGTLRELLNIRRNWRQLVLFFLMMFFIGLFVTARLWASPSDLTAGRFGPAMPFWAFLYLAATWLTASADRGLVMRPAEIHFVAGGPFRDRDVITLSLVRLAFRALVSAGVLSLIALAYVSSYVSALIGTWLLISVSLLVGMLVALASRKAHSQIVKSSRRALTFLGVAVLLLMIYQSMHHVREAGEQPRVSVVAASAIETPIGQVVLSPLRWMFAPLVSPALYPTTLGQLPARAAVICGLIALIYLLGGRFLEATANRTDQSIAKRQTALRSGLAGSPKTMGWFNGIVIPTIPRLGGVGSVAWLQIVHSIRILPRFLVFTLTIVGVVLVVPVMVDRSRLEGWGAIGWMAGLTTYADFLLLLQLPVGFLGPIAQREVLKSLPIASWRIVLGQLAGPVVPLCALHVVTTVLFLYLVPQQWGQVLVTAVALIPAALVLIANINLLGAWNVIRPRALQQRDALAAGRAMASVWIFFAMLTPTVVLATTCSVLVGNLLWQSPMGFLLGASLGTLSAAPCYLMLLARSFANWQPSSAEGGKEETELDR